jgi:intracellular sulfur oxidation DsrE/DsrF family protein
MNIRILMAGVFCIFLLADALAAGPQTGPVIKAYGPVFEVPEGALNLKARKTYKVSMDVSATGESSHDINRYIESAARFLNLHARNGIEPENIEFAIIVHGQAGKDLLTDAAYQARFSHANPNTGLLNALGEAEVKIYLCGQTAAFRGFGEKELNPSVILALSAMTAHVRLQAEGYTLIPF